MIHATMQRDDWRWDRSGSRLPAWLLSLALHVGLFALLTMSLRWTPRGLPLEEGREVGITLSPAGDDHLEPLFADEDSAEAADAAGPAEQPLFDVDLPADPAQELPNAQDLLGIGTAEHGLTTGAGGLTAGPAGKGRMSDGRARTSVFGVTGEGQKFVFVFDRSGSMGGSGRSALAAAKDELIASLKPLESTHQFQIIFYNDEPLLFQPPGRGQQLSFADEPSKQAAEKFIRQIRADGATDHERALSLALRLQPDVIFFLTDADQPVMSTAELSRVQRMNSGQAAIHAIEFGFGPPLSGENFLMRLAAQNSGQHRYVDVAQLGVTR